MYFPRRTQVCRTHLCLTSIILLDQSQPLNARRVCVRWPDWNRVRSEQNRASDSGEENLNIQRGSLCWCWSPGPPAGPGSDPSRPSALFLKSHFCVLVPLASDLPHNPPLCLFLPKNSPCKYSVNPSDVWLTFWPLTLRLVSHQTSRIYFPWNLAVLVCRGASFSLISDC